MRTRLHAHNISSAAISQRKVNSLKRNHAGRAHSSKFRVAALDR